MNENTTATAPEFDLLPCSFCGKQPELVEEPKYSFRCCCCPGFLEYPSAALAAEKWNRMNDLSNFEADEESERSSAAEQEGIFQSLKKRLSRFFRPYDLGYFWLLSFYMTAPYGSIAKLKGLEDVDYWFFVFTRSCFFAFASVFVFACFRWHLMKKKPAASEQRI